MTLGAVGSTGQPHVSGDGGEGKDFSISISVEL